MMFEKKEIDGKNIFITTGDMIECGDYDVNAIVEMVVNVVNGENVVEGENGKNEIIKQIKAISRNIKILKLQYINLGALQQSEVAEIVAAIPNTIESLDLSCNGLDRFNDKDLASIFMHLPKPKLKHLSLMGNNLRSAMTQAFSALSRDKFPELTSLDLSDNALGENDGADMAASLEVLKTTNITTINLGGNEFGLMLENDNFALIASALNQMTSVNLRNNMLSKLGSSVLEISIKNLTSDKLNELDLTGNNLGIYRLSAFKKIIAAIGVSVTSLNLSDNSFGQYHLELWKNPISIISRTIHSKLKKLDLSANFLSNCHHRDLILAFSGFKNRLDLLDLSRNDLAEISHFLLRPIFLTLKNNTPIKIRLCDNGFSKIPSVDLGYALSFIFKNGDNGTILDLSGNELETVGPNYITFLVSKLSNTAVRTLCISSEIEIDILTCNQLSTSEQIENHVRSLIPQENRYNFFITNQLQPNVKTTISSHQMSTTQ